MAVERETIIERPVEKETIIERPSEPVVVEDGGGGAALIAGIVVAITLALVIAWIFAGGTREGVTIEPPAVSQN